MRNRPGHIVWATRWKRNRRVKMEYHYRRTRRLWYRKCPHRFCHKWKCDVDRPSRFKRVMLTLPFLHSQCIIINTSSNNNKFDTTYPDLLIISMSFFLWATRFANKLLEQGYVQESLKSLLKTWSVRISIKQYEVPLSWISNDSLKLDHKQRHPLSIKLMPNHCINTKPLPYNQTSAFTELQEVSIEHLWLV